MKTLIIYFIATSNYKMGFEPFRKNIHYFFPQFNKTVVVLSDGLDEWNGTNLNGVQYKVYHIHHFPWPMITLFKMKLIHDFWEPGDYACYFNGDLQCNKGYNYFHSNYDFEKLNCMWHAGSSDRQFDETDFANISPKSVAYIEGHYKYVQASFFFGPGTIVKNMCREVELMVEKDLANNIIPQWHDESYLNKWCVDHEDLVNKQRFGSYWNFKSKQSVAIINSFKKDRQTKVRYFESNNNN